MINRRNIRVKVMQTLYTIAALEGEAKPGDGVKILQKHFDQTRQLFIYLIYFLSEVTHFAEVDALARASKHLPTYEDLHVNTKLAGNDILSKISDDASFKEFLTKDKPELLLDKELVKKIYHELGDSKEYKNYISNSKRDKRILFVAH
jgi:N utilization substance protein B